MDSWRSTAEGTVEGTVEGVEGTAEGTLEGLARRLDRALPFTEVTARLSARTLWCADVVGQAADDPLRPWRDATQRLLGERHGVCVPAHVAAAFVLQWWCEVAATPIAYAAQLGPWVLRGPVGLGFELAPGLHPERIVLLPGLAVEAVDAEGARLGRARAAYGEVVQAVVRDFAPDLKMSSRQRWGVVQDTWVTAERRAGEAAGRTVGPAPWRTSCCFIYALPGCRACASCPRLRRT